MKIDKYIDSFGIASEDYYILIITPKGKYPSRYDHKNIENELLLSPDSYIYLYNEQKPEIMQYVAFRQFILPRIFDEYSLVENKLIPVKRLNKEQIQNYFVVNSFYVNVPNGRMEEDEAIIRGFKDSENILSKFPIESYEYGFVNIYKDDDISLPLQQIDFNTENENYFFKRILVN